MKKKQQRKKRKSKEPAEQVIFRLNALTQTYPQDATGFLKKHLAPQFIDLFAESEKAGLERLVRVCFNEHEVFLEQIKGIASTEEGKGAARHFDAIEDPRIPKKGNFLALVHTHPPYKTPLKGLSPDDGLCNMSDDDMIVVLRYGSCFHIYPRGNTVRMRGAWMVGAKPKMDDIEVGKRKIH